MSKYVLLNDDNIYYVWSENEDDVNVMTLNEYNNGNYDIDNIITKKYSNSSIVATDDNLEVLRNLSKSHKQHDSEVLECNEDSAMKQIRKDVDYGSDKALNRRGFHHLLCQKLSQSRFRFK